MPRHTNTQTWVLQHTHTGWYWNMPDAGWVADLSDATMGSKDYIMSLLLTVPNPSTAQPTNTAE